MGFALYVSFETEVPDTKGSEIVGKGVGLNLDALDKIAKQMGLATLSEMISVNEEELDELIGEDMDDPEAVEDFVGGLEKDLAKLGLDLDDKFDFSELRESFAGINANRSIEGQWFDATGGLKTVRGLIAYVHQHPDEFTRGELLVKDLTDMEQDMAAAEAKGVRVRLTPDF